MSDQLSVPGIEIMQIEIKMGLEVLIFVGEVMVA
jgi:hypothetical protein